MEHKSIDKSKLNLSIDVILLLLMMPIAGIGFLMKYVLISGIQRNPIYGNNVDLEFLGLSRHEWGTIHLILSLTFLALLILHIYFHWDMILNILKRMIPDKTLRNVSTALLTIVGLLMFSFPLFVKPEILDREPLYRNRNDKNINLLHGLTEPNQFSKKNDNTLLDNNITGKQNIFRQNHQSANEEYEVFGYQTLQFVANKYHVPVSKIAADLNIPFTMIGEKLGRLKKCYSFKMEDVRTSISKHRDKK